MQIADPLIRTKLRLPFIRSELVPRPRLQEQLMRGLRGPLTLITAPAGFGKTTLVASCIAAYASPVAWLSLDQDDNRQERFLSYVIAALQETDHTIGSEASQLLTTSQEALSGLALTSLVNDLDAAGRETALVLDDYHFISNQAVHAAVAFLIEHCPRTFHLVIASRSDPPFPLARLRARGKTVELRAADLSFTEPETAQFLNDVMSLRLDAGSIALLEKRTEGWIAGLQMAALSLRDRGDVPGFIAGFSGTNRYIMDYLLEEVLTNQSPEIQRFLLYTSILERLTPTLCDAVLAHDATSKVDDSEQSIPLASSFTGPSASVLEYLERENLFVVPLDDERIWYRYHHLFVDLLHARLQQSLEHQDIAALHTRAARWYEENGLTYEAIHHASSTLDNEWVERLIEQNYSEMMQSGESLSIRFWTGKLSKELVFRRPLLCIHEAMSLAWFGQLDEADKFLDQAEKHLHSGEQTPRTRFMLGYAAYVRSRVVAMRGDIPQAIALGLAAREYIPASNQSLLRGIDVMLGYAYFLNGDFVNAAQTLTETVQSGVSADAINTTVGAYCVLARLYTVQGQLHRAFELYQEAGRFIRDAKGQHLGANSIVDVGIADILSERNDLDTAFKHIRKGLEFIQFWSKADDIALAYVIYARIQQAQGDNAAAAKTIEKASQLIQSSGVFSEARNAVVNAEARLWLQQGNNMAVSRWCASLENRCSSGEQITFDNELLHMALARTYLALEKPGEALTILSQLEAAAKSGRRTGRLIRVLVLRALVLQHIGDSEQALPLIERCLALAESEGYIRVFLDEGQPMRTLLAQWLARASEGRVREYAIHLLAQFDTESMAAIQTSHSPNDDLVEPLTERELEVLQIIALGKTNQEIARQLVVARGTIKAHTSSIYRKLNVTNRTEAVARARQLGILS